MESFNQENTYVAAHFGFPQEEIAAVLSHYQDYIFKEDPIEHIIDRQENHEHINVLLMNKYNKQSTKYPTWVSFHVFDSANDFVKKQCNGDWKCFERYDEAGTDAYYAIQSLKTVQLFLF